MNNNALSPIVNTQFPDFIRENYPMFITFVETYYQFMEQNGTSIQSVLQNALAYMDIDTTLDEFLPMFSRTYPDGIPALTSVDRRLLSKAMIQVYQTKGSLPSYNLLFQLLFDTPIEISFPKTDILKTSDGRWTQNQSIQIVVTSGYISDISGRVIYAKNSTGVVSANVDSYTLLPNGSYEVFLDSVPLNSSFLPGDTIQSNGISFQAIIQPTIVSYSIQAGGQKFRVGQLFNITSVVGANCQIKITAIGTGGSIEALTFISFGYGYVENFYATIIPTINQGAVSTPYVSYTNGFIENGLVTEQNYYAADYTDPSYTGKVLATFNSNEYIPDGGNYNSNYSATIYFQVGALSKYPGFYQTSNGFLSDSIVLQNGVLYQDYSYLISSTLPVSTYRNTVKKILHPAGTAMFGEYLIVQKLNVASSFNVGRNLLEFENITDFISTADSINFNIHRNLADSTSPSTDFLYINTSKALTDHASSVDSYKLVTTKMFTDVVTISDTRTIGFFKGLLDTVSTSDTVTIGSGKGFTDTTINSDTHTILTGKILIDTVSTNEAGKIYYQNYYAADWVETDYAATVTTFT